MQKLESPQALTRYLSRSGIRQCAGIWRHRATVGTDASSARDREIGRRICIERLNRPFEEPGQQNVVVGQQAQVATTVQFQRLEPIPNLADVVRIAVDSTKDVEALAEIRKRTKANLAVDLQENFRLAELVAPNTYVSEPVIRCTRLALPETVSLSGGCAPGAGRPWLPWH